MNRRGYPSDVSDEDWSFVLPYLTLMTLEAPQRQHDLREVFNALRYLVRSGVPWRYLPGDFPPFAGGLPALCRGTSRPGMWFINKRNAGSKRESSRA